MIGRYILFLLIIGSIISTSWAAKFSSPGHPVYVKPHIKKNGKFVNHYYRAKPSPIISRNTIK